MRINSIHSIIQGEGTSSGIPMLMVRLQGCPLRCEFCDTPYALDPNGGTEIPVQNVLAKIKEYNPTWVDFSGGEPLAQSDELRWLLYQVGLLKIKTEIETSGYLPPPQWYRYLVSCWVVDWKMPSSGVKSKEINKWAYNLRSRDSIKCVVSDEDDLEFILKNKLKTKASFIISPMVWDIKDYLGQVVIGKEQVGWIRRVAQFCQEHNFRLSLQQHKFVWGQERRDV